MISKSLSERTRACGASASTDCAFRGRRKFSKCSRRTGQQKKGQGTRRCAYGSAREPYFQARIAISRIFKKLEALHLRPLSESPLILPDIKAKIKALPPPYLYELARRTFDIDKREAFVWFLTSYLRAAYDASKCTDRTAGQGILQLPNLAPPVSRALFADKAYAKKIMKEALERERAFPEDSNPSWVCFHGIKAMVAAMQKRQFVDWTIPQSQWPTKR